MTKNITVQEHGEPREFEGVARLDTKIMGGSAMTWLPDDETTTGKLEITENGEYLAANDGLYGYSEITVNVPIEGVDRCVFGYEQDAKVAVMACTRNGLLMARMFPSYIKVEPVTRTDLMMMDDGFVAGYKINLMTANGTVYRRLMSYSDVGYLTDVEYTPAEWRAVASHVANVFPDDILYATTDGSAESGTETFLSGYGKYVSVTDRRGNRIYGRQCYTVVRPYYIAARPTWLESFSTFMDSDFNADEYVIFGREVDGDLRVPQYFKSGFDMNYVFLVDGEDGEGQVHYVPVENVGGGLS